MTVALAACWFPGGGTPPTPTPAVLVLAPDPATVPLAGGPSGSGSTQMTLTNTGGVTDGDLALTVDGLPGAIVAGATSACTGAAVGTTTCNITISAQQTGAAPGTYPATVKAQAGTASATAVLNVVVSQPTPAALQINPSSVFGTITGKRSNGEITSTAMTFTVVNTGGTTTDGNLSLSFGTGSHPDTAIPTFTGTCVGQPLIGGGSCFVTVTFMGRVDAGDPLPGTLNAVAGSASASATTSISISGGF